MSGGEWRRSKKCGETERAAPERGADRADQGRSARGGLDEGFGGKTYKRKRAEAEHNLVSGSASMDIDEEYTCQPATKRSAMASAEQIKAETEQIKAEMVTGGSGIAESSRSRVEGHRKGREGHRKSRWSRSEPRWSPAKPGEPI